MKNTIVLQVRAFPVEIRDERTGKRMSDLIILDKTQLQAGGMVGLSNEDIIYRTYNRLGYRVLEIGMPHKVALDVNLEELYQRRIEQALEDAPGAGR